MELSSRQEWKLTKLTSLAEKIMVGIASAATHAYRAKGIPMFRNQNIKSGHLDDGDLLFITPEYETVFRNKRLRTGDLVTMRTGYPGVTAIVPPQYDQSQSFTTLITRPKKDAIDSIFLCHYINSEFGQKFFEQSQIGGAQKNVNASTLRGMPIPVPPRQEQLAIGEALSDVDALIAGLEKLITKKRDLKQAAMQQLLTGQIRLPGFSGKWGVKRLGDLVEMGSGGTPPSANTAYYGGDIPWVAIADMTGGGKYIAATERNLTGLGLANSAAQMFPVGTVLYAMYASLGECSISTVPVTTSQAILGIRPKANLNPEFLYYLLTSWKPMVKGLGQQGTQSNLNKGIVADFKISLPAFEEQESIAAVLVEMDNELAALEARLSKTRELKQGMMQELLTGRTRLV